MVTVKKSVPKKLSFGSSKKDDSVKEVTPAPGKAMQDALLKPIGKAVTPFVPGTRLFHESVKNEVIVERDDGGRFVYVRYDGTQRTSFVPRDVLFEKAQDEQKVAAAVRREKSKNRKEPKVKSPDDAKMADQLSEFMSAQVTDRALVDRVAKAHGITPPDKEKPFGLAKMTLMNALRRYMKEGGKLKVEK